ncbi:MULTISPECIES: dihydrolipoamide acetyltransferase family protein [Ralstonia solanacearum species complex]|uniref:Dihydrolipoamide acetyltransferase component of pyruvate dehydrogenase complex n=15 Tax=Ralstonia solanacearum TaxID=305 RepID=A0ABF7RC03_RALSL|nr:dihydrolipoamide acetyltransferase family protein [Ralstonia solanacearum]ALF88325.1 Lipoamide acyltransferase component of branched-chain alpha-keto acid dehydrogenase complex [Ralstonia solanacearum]ATI27784.1 branched-chain alpha-keto acid dehydrogenase subunit E2 [Ralstonia solanacearum]EAP71027.1 Dihydrolipoamide acetyltransferase component of pyruvate dehydrogenase complex [Ralstonia solanacearum UW551]KFX77288.1 branched-chain alpha-keto acid dehydrogenase subunit E2 [Ralstonia solana
MIVFKLPDLGEGLQEAEIVQWHVQVGDTIEADQPLVSVETAKAIVEIPSPQAGRIARLFGQPGDIVHLGAPLVAFEGAGGDVGAAADAGTVVGQMQVGQQVVREAPAVLAAAPGAAAGGIKATPAVRALARKLDVDLSMVTPSGADGVITAADVERVAKVFAALGPPEVLRGVRRAMAQNMARAQSEVAAATVIDDADIHAWPPGTDVTIRLIRALVAGCRAEPGLNAWFDGHAGRRHVLEKIDLGIAVDLPDGLFVPVLRDVAHRDAADLRAGLDRMRADIKARKIPPEELRGNTITLSNFGMIAGKYAAPVVVPPTVAILGAGRIHEQVVAAAGAPAVHRVLPLSLTFDHRVVTGGEAARFLAAAIADLEAER